MSHELEYLRRKSARVHGRSRGYREAKSLVNSHFQEYAQKMRDGYISQDEVITMQTFATSLLLKMREEIDLIHKEMDKVDHELCRDVEFAEL